ncbi:MAG: phosphoribosylamine--glycine ligase [Clostridia bacterium]|nr:phosphoribosylamine--glycine ligase [Clostridia bacterium]
MNIMVIGGGGREHAIIKKLKENPAVETVWALPGNGGIARDAVCVPVGAKDLDGIVEFAKTHPVDYAVVAPDDPLVLGAVDRLTEAGIPCFGPDSRAAIIEGSKVFSKNLMKKYGIPTADYRVFSDPQEALYYITKKSEYPIVIKADGLALGKGVLIAQDESEARAAVTSIMVDKAFGASGNQIVVEEFLTGPEVSVLAFTDGETVKPMVSSMDHKRAADGDTGLNTGGMGTVAPNPCYTEHDAKICMEKIFLPTIKAMKKEGRTFKGCLYFGLMMTPKGPRVIEYNCRFGDPETQVVLPLLDTDLLTIMQAVTEERLAGVDIRWKNESACCVIMASDGYPGKYQKGFEVTVDKGWEDCICYAGVSADGDKILTSGGRVLGVVRTAPTLKEAVKEAYRASEHVHFQNAYTRSDIGARALNYLEREKR